MGVTGIIGANRVHELLVAHGIKPSKGLGQNFLIDLNIPEKIVRLAGFGGCDCVLEVGPGLGALTAELCRVARHVTAVELDERLLTLLRESLAEFSNVDIVHGDILKTDVAGLAREKMPGPDYHVCANLPYSITSPVLAQLIGAGVFNSIVVMVQKEVAQRICAKPGGADYGAFTVFAEYHTESEILFSVPPECFFPRPAVFSAVVRLVTRGSRALGTEDEALFFKVVRSAFGQRRKTLVNALYAVFGNAFSKDELAEVVRGCGFDERIRGEALGIDEFAALSKKLSEYGKLQK